jgi:hypothetical protein
MAFENIVAYTVLIIMFVVVFAPLISTQVEDAKANATVGTPLESQGTPGLVQLVLSLLIPFMIIILVFSFYSRIRGRRGPGSEF